MTKAKARDTEAKVEERHIPKEGSRVAKEVSHLARAAKESAKELSTDTAAIVVNVDTEQRIAPNLSSS